MKVRAITSFFDPAITKDDESLSNLSSCSKELSSALTEIGYTVQSQRVATSPFLRWLEGTSRGEWQARIIELVHQTAEMGWQYTSIGPALPENLDDYEMIPEILALHPALFACGIIAEKKQVFPAAASAAAQVITHCATITADGFTNLRFAALANVSPYAPFLPAAYAETGQTPAIALAIECANEAVIAFENAKSVQQAGERLISALENHSKQLGDICRGICDRYSISFKGFDFSPAPYPEDWCSLGKAMELLGVPRLGMSGSLTAAAFVASTLDSGKWQRTGFNGLMLPVLEDSTLARRADEGTLTIKDMLLYSAVCGTGLDTIPLPGDTTAAQITPLLMDLGALSVRLNKPLTGRLMPIPGKHAGDLTDFNFEFFANSRVMALNALPLMNPLGTEDSISINPRNI